jgi:hypothetical protein
VPPVVPPGLPMVWGCSGQLSDQIAENGRP